MWGGDYVGNASQPKIEKYLNCFTMVSMDFIYQSWMNLFIEQQKEKIIETSVFNCLKSTQGTYDHLRAK